MAGQAQDLILALQFRPKAYIGIQYVPYTITVDDIRNNTVYSKLIAPTGGYQDIGAVERLEIDSVREAGVWRQLDWLTAGKPIESFPGLPTYNIHMDRIVLYQNNLGEAFGFEDHDIIKQNKPLTLKIEMIDPAEKVDEPTTTGNTRVWYVYGVWFKSNPMQFDVVDVGDLRIIQKVDGIAAGIVASPRS